MLDLVNVNTKVTGYIREIQPLDVENGDVAVLFQITGLPELPGEQAEV